MGASLKPTVTDDDLDRHVAELILREAKKKAEKYKETGVHAYVSNYNGYVSVALFSLSHFMNKGRRGEGNDYRYNIQLFLL